jgi:hypothetical protein
MKEKLTEAFKTSNKDSILFYAADMGHYIGDANVPLHVTSNYDGQLTNQKGLHSLWESVIPEKELSGYILYSSHKATYLKNPSHAIWEAIRRSASLLPEVFAKEIEVSAGFTEAQKYIVQTRRGKEYKNYSPEFAKAYAMALKASINDQLIHSADLAADFWYTSWVDAGKPDLSGITPNWNKESKEKLKAEKGYFSTNKLIENNLLISKKPATSVVE